MYVFSTILYKRKAFRSKALNSVLPDAIFSQNVSCKITIEITRLNFHYANSNKYHENCRNSLNHNVPTVHIDVWTKLALPLKVTNTPANCWTQRILKTLYFYCAMKEKKFIQKPIALLCLAQYFWKIRAANYNP